MKKLIEPFLSILFGLSIGCSQPGRSVEQRSQQHVPVSPASLSSVSPEALVSRALAASAEGRHLEGVAILDQLVPEFPSDATLRLVRGTMLRKAGEYDRAIEDLDLVVQDRSQAADGYCQRAFCRYQQDEENWHARASADARSSLKLDNTEPLPWILLGHTRLAVGDPQGALDAFGEAILRDPNSFSAHANRALVYADLGDTEKATRDVDVALQIGGPPQEVQAMSEFRKTLQGKVRRNPLFR